MHGSGAFTLKGRMKEYKKRKEKNKICVRIVSYGCRFRCKTMFVRRVPRPVHVDNLSVVWNYARGKGSMGVKVGSRSGLPGADNIDDPPEFADKIVQSGVDCCA